jgi:hypothetical protein
MGEVLEICVDIKVPSKEQIKTIIKGHAAIQQQLVNVCLF